MGLSIIYNIFQVIIDINLALKTLVRLVHSLCYFLQILAQMCTKRKKKRDIKTSKNSATKPNKCWIHKDLYVYLCMIVQIQRYLYSFITASSYKIHVCDFKLCIFLSFHVLRLVLVLQQHFDDSNKYLLIAAHGRWKFFLLLAAADDDDDYYDEKWAK